jgi:hypothetical protein
MAYQRKTRDEWAIQGNYGDGWEDVSVEDSIKDAKRCLREYRDNETGYPHRLVKRRVWKEKT